MTRWIGAMTALVFLGLSACGMPPPPPTTINLTVAASATSNSGNPVQVKVYYLRSTPKFEGGDFFSLFNSPEATLGADLADTDNYLLTPGTDATGARSYDTAAPVAIGVIAAFRSVDQPGWRAVGALAPNTANPINVTIDGTTVTIN